MGEPQHEAAASRGARAYVGLGSNLGDRLAVLRTVVHDLDVLEHSRVLACSRVFEARALVPSGSPEQPDFLNAVVVLATLLDPFALMKELLAIEGRHGRVRGERWAARTIDLDLLAYVVEGADASVEIETPGLVLPHPQAGERDFVLAPLTELAPRLLLAGLPVELRLAALPEDARTVTRRLADPLRARGAILPPAGG